MAKSKFSVCSFFSFFALLLFSSGDAFAEVITTGSENADTILQWLTSIVTVASLVANFTPSPVDNNGVKLLSLIVNLAAANWKQLREAWKGVDKLAIGGVLLFGMMLQSPDASAASVSLTCTAPTTRADGAALPASAIAGYSFFVDGVKLNSALVTNCAYLFAVPSGQCMTVARLFTVTATDTNGNESVASVTASLAADQCTPEAKPSAPGGLKASPAR